MITRRSLVDSKPVRGFSISGKHFLHPDGHGKFDPQPILIFFQRACVLLEASLKSNLIPRAQAEQVKPTHLQATSLSLHNGKTEYYLKLTVGLCEPSIALLAWGSKDHYQPVVEALAPLFALFDTDCLRGHDCHIDGQEGVTFHPLSFPEYGLTNIQLAEV